jgi:hypothetical protein
MFFEVFVLIYYDLARRANTSISLPKMGFSVDTTKAKFQRYKR